MASLLLLDAPHFHSSNSFAKVARYHALALHGWGFPLRLHSRAPMRPTTAIFEGPADRLLSDLHHGPKLGHRLIFCSASGLRRHGRAIYLVPFDTAEVHPRWVDCARAARHLITHSHASRDALIRAGVPEHATTVIHHGFDPEFYYPGAEPMFALDRRFTFLFVSHFHPRKGVDLLLRAFRDEFGAGEDARLRLVTQAMFDGVPVAAAAAELLGAQPSDVGVELHVNRFNEGYPEREMARVYASGHCLVLPSRGEGFGLPALEARACGLEVITTRCGGMLDFLDDQSAHFVDVDHVGPNRQAAAHAGEAAELPFWEPSYASLRARMREVFEGARKPGTVAGWTWADRLAPMRALIEALT